MKVQWFYYCFQQEGKQTDEIVFTVSHLSRCPALNETSESVRVKILLILGNDSECSTGI